MFCANCGSQIPDNSAFCENCGTPVEMETAKTNEEPVSSPVKVSGGLKFLAVILSILGALLLTASIILASARSIFDGNTLKKMFERTELDAISDTLDDLAYEFGVDDVEDLLDEKEMEVLIYDMIGDLVETGITGDNVIDIDRYMDYIEQNKEVIKEVTGYKLTKSDMKEIRSELKDLSKEVEKGMKEEYPELKTYQFLLRKSTLITSIIVTAVLFALVFVIFRKCINKGFVYTGVCSTVTSSLGIAAGILLSVVFVSMEDEVADMLSILSTKLIVFEVIALAVAIAFIVAGKKLKKLLAR